MMGKHSGVSTVIIKEHPKTIATHCQGQICVLVKYSPKREKLLGMLSENVEGTLENDKQASRLDKLSVTRWTVRANCFKKIIDNYTPLMALLKASLKDKPDAETKPRINGCRKQMDSFTFSQSYR